MVTSENSWSGSLVLEKLVEAELVESLEDELDDDELEDDKLLEDEDMCRFLVDVTVVAKSSLVGLHGATVHGDTSFVTV